jgi:hypothetical protein
VNPWLAKLRALENEKQPPLGTDKTDKTGIEVGFGGFVGEQERHIFENRVPPQGATPNIVPFPTYRGALGRVVVREVAPDEHGRFCVQCGYGRDGGLDPHLDGARVVWLHAQCRGYWLRERATSQ